MNKLIENSILGAAAAILIALVTISASAQTVRTEPPAKPDVRISPPAPKAPADRLAMPPRYPEPARGEQDSYERSISVDSGVNLLLGCILEGTVSVNGWNRNEVRVFVGEGNKFNFRTLQKSSKTGSPVWIKLVGDDSKSKYGPASECISGSEIEIDAPVNSTITIKGREITTIIDSVKKVDVSSIGGNISLRNISSGVSASAGQGDITVDSSQGAMNLSTTTGNILVFEAGPSEIGDGFKANTNSGTIALQSLEYRQMTVDSVTGSVAYTGEIMSSGSYNLRTSKGSIRLTIPAKSSFQMWATYGFGNFTTEIPVDIATENISPGPIKSIRGKAGSGDATLKLTTNNGSIGIKKM